MLASHPGFSPTNHAARRTLPLCYYYLISNRSTSSLQYKQTHFGSHNTTVVVRTNYDTPHIIPHIKRNKNQTLLFIGEHGREGGTRRERRSRRILPPFIARSRCSFGDTYGRRRRWSVRVIKLAARPGRDQGPMQGKRKISDACATNKPFL